MVCDASGGDMVGGEAVMVAILAVKEAESVAQCQQSTKGKPEWKDRRLKVERSRRV